MIPDKVFLMSKLQEAGFKVFVDYSADMSNMTERFMDENNVRFVVRLKPEEDGKEKGILCTDRSGGSEQLLTRWAELIERIRQLGSSSRFT